jgi:RES domain
VSTILFQFGVAAVPIDLSAFETVESNIHALDVDEIKQALQPLMLGYQIRSPIVDPGTFLYRARKLGPTFNKVHGITKEQLIYPPKEKALLGRVNRAGSPVFYASVNKESVFFELPDLNTGDEVVLTFWKTTERMLVNNIGYTEFAFRQLGAKRAVPTWAPASPMPSGGIDSTVRLSTIPPEEVIQALSHDENRELKEAFGKYFTRQISPDESFRYKLTVALAEMHLGNIAASASQLAGILYPSVRMFANGDNLALLPWFVDRHLEFLKAIHVQIKGRTVDTFNIDYLDAAHGFDAVGNLAWLGRNRAWSLKPGQTAQIQVVAGRDEDGNYVHAADGSPIYCVATDLQTGEVLQMG